MRDDPHDKEMKDVLQINKVEGRGNAIFTVKVKLVYRKQQTSYVL